jgi:drug/metabolite transporter (DMT)-like permease
LTAILMWSLLSVLTVATGKIPAFQLAAMTFAIGAAVAFASWIRRPAAFGALRQPLTAWVVGVGGLFGYHALYFLALRFAPPAEAGLLNYLWPLLIVLFSSLLPGERLAPHHIIGALLGLAGTVLLFAGNSGGFAPGQIPGLAAAFVAAFVWAAYSVMSRKLKAVPTDAVAGFCLATALLAALVHGMVEATVWPESIGQWLAIAALGVGPVGAAFFTWDIGMKRGDIRVLGAASYATPLLSTAFLISRGLRQADCYDRHRRDPDCRRRPDCGEGYGLEAGLSDGLLTRLSAATNPALRVRTWQNRNRARPCIRPASSHRCSRRIARYAAVQSPAVARRLRDQRQA